MLKEMDFIDHQHKRCMVRMKICNNRKCQMFKMQTGRSVTPFTNLFGNIQLLPSNQNAPPIINVQVLFLQVHLHQITLELSKFVFFPMIKSSNRNNQVFMKTLNNIKTTQLKIEQYRLKVHKHNFKGRLQYFKA